MDLPFHLKQYSQNPTGDITVYISHFHKFLKIEP